ncbi:MAG: universal stress protein [Phycisphaerae bacterium]
MEVSPKRVLWPTDFSELSLCGGRYASGFCEHFGAELHIIHVVPPPLSPDVSLVVPAEVPVAISEPELVEASQTALDQLVEQHFGRYDKVVTKVFFGNPWPSICNYAKENDIDLIIITTHGRTGLSHALIRSTAERIVQHAPCPVLTVKHAEKEFLSE